MATRTFPKVYRRLGMFQNAKGELVLDGGALEHRSDKHGTLRMDPVREISVVKEVVDQHGGEGHFVKVVYGEADTLGSALLLDLRSKLHPKRNAEELAAELQEALGAPAAASGQDVERLRETDRALKGMVSQAAAKRGRTRMWVGAIAVIAGAIATLIGYTAASDSGGTYYVFWGAMVFGALIFIQGLVEYRKNHPRGT
ncbi:MAG: hypothetical protein ABR518_07250 [Actinomycetota bacterium]